MASFGTQKVPTTNLNVGFPDPFAYWYAGSHRPEQFMPEKPMMSEALQGGNDLQARYHQQKKADSHRMAMAKVYATQVANAKSFSSPHGYYQLPPAVLGQRRIAAPEYGLLSASSARLDVPGLSEWSIVENPYQSFGGGGRFSHTFKHKDAHLLRGGVLRTTVGQDWAKTKLNDRIRQFNEIDQAKMMFQSGDLSQIPSAPFAGATASLSSEVGIVPQIELASLLQNVIDSLMSPGEDYVAITRFVVEDSSKIFSLLVNLATHNSAEDIQNALEFIEGGSTQDGITQLIANQLANIQEDGATDVPNPMGANIAQMLSTLEERFQRMEMYLKQMLKVVDSPYKDRVTASNTLIKSLGFNKLQKETQQLFSQIGNANRETLAYPRGQPPQQSGAFIAPEPSDYAEGEAYFPGSYKGVARSNRAEYRRGVSNRDRFEERRQLEYDGGDPYGWLGSGGGIYSAAGATRENSQMGYVGDGGQQFSSDSRGAFGDRSGRFVNSLEEAPSDEGQYNTGGRPIGYMEGAEDLADEGGAEEGDEAEGLAELAAAEDSTPRMRSTRGPDGDYDIAVNRNAYRETPPPSLSISELPAAAATAPAAMAPRLTEDDVPRERGALLSFIQRLRQTVPGYNQAVYNKADSKTASIRRHTLRTMTKAGLL